MGDFSPTIKLQKSVNNIIINGQCEIHGFQYQLGFYRKFTVGRWKLYNMKEF